MNKTDSIEKFPILVDGKILLEKWHRYDLVDLRFDSGNDSLVNFGKNEDDGRGRDADGLLATNSDKRDRPIYLAIVLLVFPRLSSSFTILLIDQGQTLLDHLPSSAHRFTSAESATASVGS
ncbi:hypothetical protein V3C99_010863 [Haemonchus contortus]